MVYGSERDLARRVVAPHNKRGGSPPATPTTPQGFPSSVWPPASHLPPQGKAFGRVWEAAPHTKEIPCCQGGRLIAALTHILPRGTNGAPGRRAPQLRGAGSRHICLRLFPAGAGRLPGPLSRPRRPPGPRRRKVRTAASSQVSHPSLRPHGQVSFAPLFVLSPQGWSALWGFPGCRAFLTSLPCSSSPEQTRLRWALLRFPPQAAGLGRPGPPQTFSRRRREMTWATFTPEAPAWARPRVMPAPSPMANMPGSLVSSSGERVRREE